MSLFIIILYIHTISIQYSSYAIIIIIIIAINVVNTTRTTSYNHIYQQGRPFALGPPRSSGCHLSWCQGGCHEGWRQPGRRKRPRAGHLEIGQVVDGKMMGKFGNLSMKFRHWTIKTHGTNDWTMMDNIKLYILQ